MEGAGKKGKCRWIDGGTLRNFPTMKDLFNAAVVINQEGNPKGTRVFGPVA
jgi:ribosomal protein L14